MKFFKPNIIHIISSLVTFVIISFVSIVPQRSVILNYQSGASYVTYYETLIHVVDFNFIHLLPSSYAQNMVSSGNKLLTIATLLLIVIISYSVGYLMNILNEKRLKRD